MYVANVDTTEDTEERIYEIFSRCGEVKRVTVGVHRKTLQPCGFCFVVFATHEAAAAAYAFLTGFDVDDRGIADPNDLLKVCVCVYFVHQCSMCMYACLNGWMDGWTMDGATHLCVLASQCAIPFTELRVRH